MAGQDWFEKDFYAVLGVPADATADQVKKAYRRLARQHHPDANAGDTAAEHRFKEVGEAYAVLSDPEQRQQYDAVRAMARGGARFTSGGPGATGAGGFEDLLSNLFGQATGPRNVRFTTTGGPGPGGPSMPPPGSPIFEDLIGRFGASSPGFQPGPQPGFRSPRGPRRGEDLAADATISFKQAVDGALLSLSIPEPHGATRTVRARVPAGVRDSQKLRLRGKGRPGDLGAEPGDLVVTVHVAKHPVFELDGENIRVTVPVTFPEAVNGAQVEVPTPDGATVRLKVPAGTPSGRVLRVKGRGVAGQRRTGDLLVTVQVAVPQRLDAAAREALEAYEKATAGLDPRADLLAQARGAGPAAEPASS